MTSDPSKTAGSWASFQRPSPKTPSISSPNPRTYSCYQISLGYAVVTSSPQILVASKSSFLILVSLTLAVSRLRFSSMCCLHLGNGRKSSLYLRHSILEAERSKQWQNHERFFKLLPRCEIDHFHSQFIGQSTSYIQAWPQWGKNTLPTGKASGRCPLGNHKKEGQQRIWKNNRIYNVHSPLAWLKFWNFVYLLISPSLRFTICIRAKIISYTHHVVGVDT